MATTIDVIIPNVGESISEAAIGRWFVKSGDYVEKDQALLELDSDKASMEVTAENSGKIEILSKEGEVVQIGATVAKIDTSASGSSNVSSAGKAAKKTTAVSELKSAPREEKKSLEEKSLKESTEASSVMAQAAGAEDAQIMKFPPSQRKAIRHGHVEILHSQTGASNPFEDQPAGETRTPMTNLRKTIAGRLLHSQQSTATLTTFNEINMSQSMKVRSELKEAFQKKFGVKLGFMSIFSKAVIHAIKQYPIVNSYIENDEIVSPRDINLGIAVSTDRGLVVPVIRKAESLSYAELEVRIGELAEKARNGKLSIPEMQGGSFTITNGGVFGSLLSTPILNPPQSGILGMHKIENRPIAVESDSGFKVEVHPMMYVALSYDHRLIDGATSVGFLIAVKTYIEELTANEIGV